jgi:putative PIN family toxin of toxin-antitoxin system
VSEPERRQRVYRVTIDTNIFFRSLHRQDNFANHLLSLWHNQQFVLVLSQDILDEVREVLLRPHLMERYSYTRQEAIDLINDLTQDATPVEVPCSYKLCRDRNDDRFVDCAIWGKAQFLTSYDNDILGDSTLRQALFEFGVEIVHPHAFVGRIQEE